MVSEVLMHSTDTDIVMFSDSLLGGAACAASGLADGLVHLELPFQRWHFTASSSEHPSYYRSLDPSPKRPPFERILKNFSRSTADRLRSRRHETAFRQCLTENPPTLLNVHNLHGCGLNHDHLPEQLPIVWTLHDCWAFSPEAFAWKDSRVEGDQFAAPDRPLAAAKERRRRFFQREAPVVLVSPSLWLADLARSQTPDKVRVEHIPYGVDAESFAPSDPKQTRKAMELEEDRVWLGHASTWASSRKGFDVLSRALHSLDCSRLGLILWGELPSDTLPENLAVRRVGPLSGSAKLAEHYSACDAFVCPSRADNLPNAVLESLACGTPVIGTAVGGIPDIARPGETGFLFSGDDPGACASAIENFLAARESLPAMRKRCREVAVNEYSLSRQAESYGQLFEELLGS